MAAFKRKYLRAVETSRGAGVYYYFSFGCIPGKRNLLRLPDISHPDFEPMYRDCMRRRGYIIPAPKRQRPAQGSILYFIGTRGVTVKIGRTANLKGRLDALQTGYPHKIEVLAVSPVDGDREREYHKRFKIDRLTGEWFKWSDEIAAEIEFINGNFDQQNIS